MNAPHLSLLWQLVLVSSRVNNVKTQHEQPRGVMVQMRAQRVMQTQKQRSAALMQPRTSSLRSKTRFDTLLPGVQIQMMSQRVRKSLMMSTRKRALGARVQYHQSRRRM
mmetsp:Transcript_9686/g.18813  ORF Transcript_9686/g.18813 Transcript_9686/m.18813 type:complete len:109 (+) Transcript_9686:256-582(+)